MIAFYIHSHENRGSEIKILIPVVWEKQPIIKIQNHLQIGIIIAWRTKWWIASTLREQENVRFFRSDDIVRMDTRLTTQVVKHNANHQNTKTSI